MVPVLAISSGTMVASGIPKYYRTVNGRFSSFHYVSISGREREFDLGVDRL
uniref:Uncharacterized protein n=1 Tax=Anguilla anguilla TaxID=7936 RepID=A0A0E9WDX5_ANGAN